jgi:uncharacterized pyridoxamine 5'-phosphate oxidase family protein
MELLQLLREIKSVSFATVNEGKPAVRIIDVMMVEKNKLYFCTARGKQFYKQLLKMPYVSITGINSDYVTARVEGPVEKLDQTYIDKIFEANPMMNDLYPGDKRYILEAFCLSPCHGEIFDLSAVPAKREKFTFGEFREKSKEYVISDRCISCGVCETECPANAISSNNTKYHIDSHICLECGRCFEACPVEAIAYE